MFELIEKLRRKPDKTKKRIAFSIAFILAGLIFVLWLGVVYPNFRSDAVTQSANEDRVAKLTPSPITSFADTIASGFSAMGEEFNKLKSTISSFATSTTYYTATSSETMATSSGAAVVAPDAAEASTTSQ